MNIDPNKFFADPNLPEIVVSEGKLSPEDLTFMQEVVLRGITEKITDVHPGRLALKKPEIFPLIDYLEANKEKIKGDVKLLLPTYDFYRMSLVFEQTPKYGFRFYQITLEVQLSTIEGNTDLEPIVHELKPLNHKKDVTVSREYGFNGEIEFDFEAIKARLGADKKQSREYIEFQSLVQAYGLKSSSAGWRFTVSEYQEINPLQEVFMVIRCPKGTKTKATISLDAQVQRLTKSGPIGPFMYNNTKIVHEEILSE